MLLQVKKTKQKTVMKVEEKDQIEWKGKKQKSQFPKLIVSGKFYINPRRILPGQ